MFVNSEKEGVFIIGHASAVIKLWEDGRFWYFLCDPVWDHSPYGKHWEFVPEQVNLDKYLHLFDGCFVSHIHEDHLCDRIISKLKCPIWIMSGRPQLKDRLSKLNPRVFEIAPRTPFAIIPDMAMGAYFVPHEFNSIDSSVFIFGISFTAYHGNDNFLSDETARNLAQIFPRIDVAMVPYSFIHWYPHLLKNITEEERLSESERLNKQSLDQASSFIRHLDPMCAIPFGSSMFYRGGRNHPLNKLLARPHDLVGATPILAGGYYLDDRIYVNETSPERYENLLDSISDDKESHMNLHFQPTDKQVEKIEEKLATIKFYDGIPDHVIIVNSIPIYTNLLIVADAVKTNRTTFNFDKPVFEKWVGGKITFEQAIGTRRFECIREPNVYDLTVFEFMNKFL